MTRDMEDEMRTVKMTVVAVLLAALSLTACEPVDRGHPMGGRDYEHGMPGNGACDPHGVQLFQPDGCRK